MNNTQRRYKIISAVIFICFSVAAVRLFQTTMLPDPRLQSQGERGGIRGNIYDRKGRLIAGASSTQSLFARPNKLSPELIDYIKNYFRSLGSFSEAELSNLDKTDRSFIYIKRDLTPSLAAPVQSLITLLKKEDYIPNDVLELISEESRFYPYPFLTPILGVLGRDKKGLYGLEYAIDSQLRQGHSATVSLDAQISRVVYEELDQVVKSSDADSGSVVVISLSNREILSLVQISSNNHPTSIAHIYEPGSVMKLFTAAFAMEQGIASTVSPTFNDAQPYKVGDYTFSRPLYGYINLKTMLQKSANVSFARMSEQFGSHDYYLWLTELGFGKKPNLPLPSLERGILHPPSKWSALSKPMIAIGQEIGVTSLQLAIAASVIGGKGVYTPPILLTSMKNMDGEELLEISRTNVQLFHPQKAMELLYASETALQAGGTASDAAVEGIRIGGKTGTGQIATSDGYGIGRNNTVFIGILPVENPSMVVVIAVHNPKGNKRSGGGIAAPLFAKIVRRILLVDKFE
ncbi:MAG: peptidoglycan D,D-transpeptidase FtsI family protein [Brevinema sp.]